MMLATTPYRRSMHRNLLGGALAILILVGGLGLWTALAEVSGAVIAHGHVTVDSSEKKVSLAEYLSGMEIASQLAIY